MKIIKYTILLTLLFSTELILAQPLPPSNPTGNPVPAENALWISIMGLFSFGLQKIKGNTNILGFIKNLFKSW